MTALRVGSWQYGQMPAWNFSHEFNVLIDDAPTVAKLRLRSSFPDGTRR